MEGSLNYLWLILVVLCIAFFLPGKPFLNTNWMVPRYLREGLMLLLALISWLTTPLPVRQKNQFNFLAIGEVAFLFIGIFICMMPPLEILQVRGSELGLTKPWHFFWATGILSSFLDNAPTYAIFFETALALEPGARIPSDPLLIAISTGAVFMGAMTYIGNGPNFIVKSMAEGAGIDARILWLFDREWIDPAASVCGFDFSVSPVKPFMTVFILINVLQVQMTVIN